MTGGGSNDVSFGEAISSFSYNSSLNFRQYLVKVCYLCKKGFESPEEPQFNGYNSLIVYPSTFNLK